MVWWHQRDLVHQSCSRGSKGISQWPAEGIPHCGTLAMNPTKKLEKERKITQGFFYIYMPGKSSAVTQTAAWFGVSAASICVSWASQADSWHCQRTYKSSTRKVSQKGTSIFPASPVPLPGWHMWEMLCAASSGCEVTPPLNEFPKSSQQVPSVAQVGFHWSPPGLSLSEDGVSNFWLMKIIIMYR